MLAHSPAAIAYFSFSFITRKGTFAVFKQTWFEKIVVRTGKQRGKYYKA